MSGRAEREGLLIFLSGKIEATPALQSHAHRVVRTWAIRILAKRLPGRCESARNIASKIQRIGKIARPNGVIGLQLLGLSQLIQGLGIVASVP